MTLDKEDHRKILMEMVEQTAFPGRFAEQVVELKQALASAEVTLPKAPASSAPR